MTAAPLSSVHDAAALVAEVADRGYAVARLPNDLGSLSATDPWTFAERLFGEAPVLVERQPIRAVAGARSFAANTVFTPLHTDSQLHRGIPAHAQVLHCTRPATRGGETLLLDTRELVERVRSEEPPLFAELLGTERRIPFYFGEVGGPTLALRGGSLAFTHSPFAADPVAQRLAPHIARSVLVELALGAGETLIVDNHRMLHGRRAFDDTARTLMRVLVWRSVPFARAHDAATPWPAREVAAPPPTAEAARRLALVLALLRGVPAGVLSARAEIPERQLYAWRDAFLAAGAAAMVGDGSETGAKGEPL